MGHGTVEIEGAMVVVGGVEVRGTFLYFHVFCHGSELSYYRGCLAKL